MPKHPTARRVHREAEGPDDAFVANVLEASVWAKRNSRILIVSTIVLVVAVLGTLYYVNYRAQIREQAGARLNQVRQTVASGNPALAARDLETFIDRFGNTPAGDEARLLLAQVHLHANAPEKALDVTEPLAEDKDEVMGATAALLQAAAFEQAKQLDQAERTYLSIAEEAPFSYQRYQALDRAAILRMDSGNAAGAAELYRRILDSAPETLPQRPLYELRLGEAEAMAAATGRS